MRRPDFARTNLSGLADRDLEFLIENMPQPGGSYQEIAKLINDLPTTLESMLTSEYVFQMICDQQRQILNISPFLLFSVLLRRSLARPKSSLDRQVINYLANLLTLFIRTDRVYRVELGDSEPREYVVDLLQDVQEADPHRQFITYAHIGNYALWLTGLQLDWLEYRHRYHRRPIDTQYYVASGQSNFGQAARHRLAREFSLEDVFLRLAMRFEYYKQGLNYMTRHFVPRG